MITGKNKEAKEKMMFDALGFEIRILSNLIYNRLNQITLEAENLTIHQYWILSYLMNSPDGMNSADGEVYQKDVEQLLSVKRSTANEMLRTMEERGYIRRTVSPGNARRNVLSVTKTGIAARTRLAGDLSRCMQRLFQEIPDSELEQFQKTLHTLRCGLEA